MSEHSPLERQSEQPKQLNATDQLSETEQRDELEYLVSVHLYMPVSLHRSLETLAIIRGLTIDKLVFQMVQDWLVSYGNDVLEMGPHLVQHPAYAIPITLSSPVRDWIAEVNEQHDQALADLAQATQKAVEKAVEKLSNE